MAFAAGDSVEQRAPSTQRPARAGVVEEVVRGIRRRAIGFAGTIGGRVSLRQPLVLYTGCTRSVVCPGKTAKRC